MASKTPSPVRLTWHASGEESTVAVVGSWSDWFAEPMNKEGDRFVLDKLLTPGNYEYKFIVDGMWRNDSTKPSLLVNGFQNHRLSVLPSVRIRIWPPRGSTVPHTFSVNPQASLDETVRRAKLQCGILDEHDYNFIRLSNGEKSKISSSSDLHEEDLLFLMLSSSEHDDLDDMELESRAIKAIVNQQPSQLRRSDTNEVVFTGTLDEAMAYASTNRDNITVPLGDWSADSPPSALLVSSFMK